MVFALVVIVAGVVVAVGGSPSLSALALQVLLSVTGVADREEDGGDDGGMMDGFAAMAYFNASQISPCIPTCNTTRMIL